MAIETDADRLALLDTFGETVIVDPSVSAVSIKAIYDAGHVLIDDGTAIPLSTVRPQLWVRDVDATSIDQGTIIERQGTNYAVSDIQPDGTGMTLLEIHKQDA